MFATDRHGLIIWAAQIASSATRLGEPHCRLRSNYAHIRYLGMRMTRLQLRNAGRAAAVPQRDRHEDLTTNQSRPDGISIGPASDGAIVDRDIARRSESRRGAALSAAKKSRYASIGRLGGEMPLLSARKAPPLIRRRSSRSRRRHAFADCLPIRLRPGKGSRAPSGCHPFS